MSSDESAFERIFEFTQTDLEANRRGEMTRSQAKKLHSMKWKYLWNMLLVVGMSLFSAYTIFPKPYVSRDFVIPADVNLFTCCIPVFLVLLGLGSGIYCVWKFISLFSDAVLGRVQQVDSYFSLSERQFRYPLYYLHTSNFDMQIPSRVYHSLSLIDYSKRYIWYYSAESHIVLSVEKRR